MGSGLRAAARDTYKTSIQLGIIDSNPYVIPKHPPGEPSVMTGRSLLEENLLYNCLLYTSDAADDTPCVDLGGRRIIKKKNKKKNQHKTHNHNQTQHNNEHKHETTHTQ
eukprot:TRINITY_DN12251_c0_g1_i4.p1 TRINITY_DN12251_c0_g1~~TRINITY_DN12251_c0_g1_i4.p1  ORF type:complete len:109 (-),score=17.29 TRINITY_DN12251_c0_g1_i4:32-358(-)